MCSCHSAYRALIDRHIQGGGRECGMHAAFNYASNCLQLRFRSISGIIPRCNSRQLELVCAKLSGS